jgi:hypothetical protein
LDGYVGLYHKDFLDYLTTNGGNIEGYNGSINNFINFNTTSASGVPGHI